MENVNHPYKNHCIAFTTMHEKEKLLAPLFANCFSARIVATHNVDTDQLGTFSGEVQRGRDLKSVLRKKAMLGLDETGLSFGIASEGSFGPHPWIPFIECNQESLIFIDLERNIEIFSNFISTDNKAMYIEAEKLEQIKDFFKIIDFGNQGVIVKPSHEYIESSAFIFKGLTKEAEVFDAFHKIKSYFQIKTVWIETDNRAHMSPKRRMVIAQSGKKLLAKLNSLCPNCNVPGFEMTDYIKGLVCSACGLASDKPIKEIWSCPNQECDYKEIRDRSDGIDKLDPQECSWCNP